MKGIVKKMGIPEGKYIFGTVTVGTKGQIVIPKQAREVFEIAPGDKLVMLGDIEQGMALIKSDKLLNFTSEIMAKATAPAEEN